MLSSWAYVMGEMLMVTSPMLAPDFITDTLTELDSDSVKSNSPKPNVSCPKRERERECKIIIIMLNGV